MNHNHDPDHNESTKKLLEKRKKLQRFSHILDDAFVIPVINYRIGWDAIIGFIPVIGDGIGLILGAYFIFEGKRLNLPLSSLAKMFFNILFEFLIGMIPIFGDFFDISWRANKKNYDIINRQICRQLEKQGVTLDNLDPLIVEMKENATERRFQTLWLVLTTVIIIYAFLVFPEHPWSIYDLIDGGRN